LLVQSWYWQIIAALKCFFELENTALLLMNIKFYNTLNLNKYYNTKICTWSSDKFLNSNINDKICIIDECQRLSLDQIVQVAKKSKNLILFGDLEQSFMSNDLMCGKKDIENAIKELGKSTKLRPLKTVKRFSNSASKAIECLTNYTDFIPDEKLHGYKINIYYNESDFLNSYKNYKGTKKIFTTYNNKDNKIMKIATERFWLAGWNYDNFATDYVNEDIIGNTLHAISFDVEHCYVYLPDLKIKEEQGKIYFINNSTTDNEKTRKLHNELTILFSRGQLSLNIMVNDLKTYLLLNRRYKTLI